MDPCPTGWSWSVESRSCYYFATGAQETFLDAEMACNGMGATLLSVLDATEQNFINAQLDKLNLGKQNLWIGLNDSNKDGLYLWSSGYMPLYNNFDCDCNCVNSRNDICVVMYASGAKRGKWDDQTCGTKNGYICKTVGPNLSKRLICTTFPDSVLFKFTLT